MKNAIILVLAAACCSSCLPARAGQEPPREGRFQIINPTPTFARETMLLDSATGETWRICETAQGETVWCRMPRSNLGSSRADSK